MTKFITQQMQEGPYLTEVVVNRCSSQLAFAETELPCGVERTASNEIDGDEPYWTVMEVVDGQVMKNHGFYQ